MLEELDSGLFVSMDGAGTWRAKISIRRGLYSGVVLDSVGKGANAEERKASAIGECLEHRAVFERSADVIGSYAELGPEALDPRELGLDLPGEEAPGCVAFAPEAAISWTRFRSLAGGDERLLPRPVRGERGAFFLHSTSGAASGNSPEFALWRGLLELIERDALTLAWRVGDGGRTIAPEHGPGPALSWLSRHGMTTTLRDISTDLGVPVVLAIGQLANGGSLSGCGSGPSLDQAARSAVLEIVQAYEAHLTCLASDDPRLRLDDNLQNWLSGEHGDVMACLPEAPAESPAPAVNGAAGSLEGLARLLADRGFAPFGLVEEVAPGWYAAETIAVGLVPFPKQRGDRGMRLGSARLQAEAAKRGVTLNRLPIPL